MRQRPFTRLRAYASAIIPLALLVAGISACVSERSTSTTPIDTANCTTPSNVAGSTLVFIRSFLFVPATVHVKAGESVAWVNCEPTNIPHTSTSDAAGWESGTLAPNEAFMRTFPTAGTFPYHCLIHPNMKATVVVE
jgi:plastocyanin